LAIVGVQMNGVSTTWPNVGASSATTRRGDMC
jgi:hypothetical protein